MRAAPSANLLDDLCRLARLRLHDASRRDLADRLDAVMQSFSDLRNVPTAAEGTTRNDATCALRRDEPSPVLTQEQALANASRTAGGCFLVPRVVEG